MSFMWVIFLQLLQGVCAQLSIQLAKEVSLKVGDELTCDWAEKYLGVRLRRTGAGFRTDLSEYVEKFWKWSFIFYLRVF